MSLLLEITQALENPKKVDIDAIIKRIDKRLNEIAMEKNIETAKCEVESWPQWKRDNIKSVFSEPEIKVPSLKLVK